MKIANLMGALNRGGAETLVLDVCRNATKAQLDTLLVHRRSGLLAENFMASGVEMIRLRPRSPGDLKYLARLRKLVVRKQIDVLHAHQVLDAVYALLATAGLSTKVVLSLHGHGVGDGILSGLMRRLAISGSDRILFVSEYQRNHYVKRFGTIKKGLVIHNGLDFGKFTGVADKSLRKELGVGSETMLFGTVGNFSPGRDQLTICRFLALLKKAAVPFHFVFVGGALPAEPKLYQACANYCAEHDLSSQVSFLGSRSDVPTILPQLDAFVYSTVHDTFGIAVVEAIANGIPVFVNDWEVMREVAEDGDWATLYGSRDEQDLLEKFLDFYKNQGYYHDKARRNAVAVRAHYSIENYLTTLKEMYAAL